MRSLSLLAFVLLAVSPAAARPMSAGPRVYPEVSAPWRDVLGARANPAIVYELSTSLRLAPSQVAAMSPQELAGNIDLAQGQVREHLPAAAAQLIVDAHRAAASGERLGQLELDRLHDLTARAREFYKHYGEFLDPAQFKATENAYKAVFKRYTAAREDYLMRLGETGARALANDRRDEDAAIPERRVPIVLEVKQAGRDMRESMSRTTQRDEKFSQHDVDTLLDGYGFTRREGEHRVYRREGIPGAYVVVPRHNRLHSYVINKALAAVAAVEAAALPASAIELDLESAELPPRVSEALRISRPGPTRVLRKLEMPLDPSLAAAPVP